MPVYVLGPDDLNNLGKISTNLCPYFSSKLATVQVQSVNTIANIEILNEDDYIDITMIDCIPTEPSRYIFVESASGYLRYKDVMGRFYEWEEGDRLINDNSDFPLNIELLDTENEGGAVIEIDLIDGVTSDEKSPRKCLKVVCDEFSHYLQGKLTGSYIIPQQPLATIVFTLNGGGDTDVYFRSNVTYKVSAGDILACDIPYLYVLLD
jgi:hypothetical protein